MPNDNKNNNKNNKPKSQEEMQQELNKLNADEKAAEERAKAEKQRKDTEAKLEKARKKAEKRKRAEEKAAKKRAKEDADARAGKKKEKLFDRGFLPAVGFALGAAVGAILGYSIVIAPFLIASFFSAAVKFTIWGGKKAARAYRSFNEAKKIGAKKAEEKEKEESKKSEKELDKTIEKEKNKVVDSSLNKQKANEQDVMIEMVDMTGKAAQEEKNDPVKYQLKIARHDETAAMQMSINEKNFGEKKGEFVKHLANVAVLKSLEMAAKDGKEIPVDAINQENIDKLSENFAKKDPFKSMSDGIKTPADIEKFKKLAGENESGGLIDEMNKHMPKAEQEKKGPKKENVLQKQQQQPQMIGHM